MKDRSKLLREAKELEKAGVFAIVLEMVTSETSNYSFKKFEYSYYWYRFWKIL